VGPSAMRVFMD